MRIRDKTKIGPHWFKTKFKSESNDGYGASGSKFGWQCEIWLNTDADKSKQECTYLHEIIHEINYQHGLDLKESQVDTLGTCLYQVLTDNDLLKLDTK